MVLKIKPKQLSQDPQKVTEPILKPVAATKTHKKVYVFVSKTKTHIFVYRPRLLSSSPRPRFPDTNIKLQVMAVSKTTSDERLPQDPQ